jgi:hydrogenase maturation protease
MSPPALAARTGQRTIIGLGNEFLSDDGLGIMVVRDLRKRLPADTATFEELSIGGLELLDYITGYEECVIVDAIATGTRPPGTLYRCVQKDPESTVPMRSSHQIDLMQVVRLAGLLGAAVPRRIVLYGIEAGDVTTFHEGCTADVARAIPRLVHAICMDLQDPCLPSGDSPGTWQVVHHTLSD